MIQFLYDYLVFIGRFEPLHIGHLQVMITALQKAQTLIILIGSSNQPRTFKNPWTYMERVEMIYAALREHDAQNGTNFHERVICQPLRDITENDEKWATQVQELVADGIRQEMVHDDVDFTHKPKIGIVGHAKDSTSYYLKLFPQWGEPLEHEMNEDVSATDLRTLLYESKSTKFLMGVLPHAVYEIVLQFRETPEYTLLVEEYETIKKYKKAWAAAPYAPTFVTTDAVVIQSGHILLIKRRATPGKGLLALPGGFLEQDEFIQEGMIRELREETKLKIPSPVLIGNIKEIKVFDRPNRSARGRTITHAFHIQLPPGVLPPVKGSDDAVKAEWIPLSQVREDEMFEDHFQIIQYFTGID